jgi:hypothetical protein
MLSPEAVANPVLPATAERTATENLTSFADARGQTTGETDGNIDQQGFVATRMRWVRERWQGLTLRQQDALQIGAMVTATAILPAANVLLDFHPQQLEASKDFLALEGLTAWAVMFGVATRKVVNGIRKGQL